VRVSGTPPCRPCAVMADKPKRVAFLKVHPQCKLRKGGAGEARGSCQMAGCSPPAVDGIGFLVESKPDEEVHHGSTG